LELEEDGISPEEDGGKRVKELATEAFEYLLEENAQSIRVVGL
jgi:hypothetical protein